LPPYSSEIEYEEERSNALEEVILPWVLAIVGDCKGRVCGF